MLSLGDIGKLREEITDEMTLLLVANDVKLNGQYGVSFSSGLFDKILESSPKAHLILPITGAIRSYGDLVSKTALTVFFNNIYQNRNNLTIEQLKRLLIGDSSPYFDFATLIIEKRNVFETLVSEKCKELLDFLFLTDPNNLKEKVGRFSFQNLLGEGEGHLKTFVDFLKENPDLLGKYFKKHGLGFRYNSSRSENTRRFFEKLFPQIPTIHKILSENPAHFQKVYGQKISVTNYPGRSIPSEYQGEDYLCFLRVDHPGKHGRVCPLGYDWYGNNQIEVKMSMTAYPAGTGQAANHSSPIHFSQVENIYLISKDAYVEGTHQSYYMEIWKIK